LGTRLTSENCLPVAPSRSRRAS